MDHCIDGQAFQAAARVVVLVRVIGGLRDHFDLAVFDERFHATGTRAVGSAGGANPHALTGRVFGERFCRGNASDHTACSKSAGGSSKSSHKGAARNAVRCRSAMFVRDVMPCKRIVYRQSTTFDVFGFFHKTPSS
ncbi:Uncharacterised protein [Chlamydia trachomatis]|nr:Uncharacterised protein [Chlamydia trachomatis]